ncbi:hypothetical protein A3K86_15250 [Photobacterium jeanii]|uniref:Uncharacterized protein n=1 Tax=Photobacterium jeanii TaxID=858640 RepID=A0A178K6W1_9GAMM|nr:hypothetical protein [Photobacterium jeanii]OAN13021.1 hypothetical protein A3K86_15250 [Photobacterium jeanii]PST89170.1 hypothetical protein C9I91_13695 [Photobacterium jeanii]
MNKAADIPSYSPQEDKETHQAVLAHRKSKVTLSLTISQCKYVIALMGMVTGIKLSIWFPLALTQLYLKVFN